MYRIDPEKLAEMREALETVWKTLTDENGGGEVTKAIIFLSSAALALKDWTGKEIDPAEITEACSDLETACKKLAEAQYYDTEEQDINDILFDLRQEEKAAKGE